LIHGSTGGAPTWPHLLSALLAGRDLTREESGWAMGQVMTAEASDVQLAGFLMAQRDFSVDDPRPHLPERARALVGSDGILRTFPHRHGLDGFFSVRLKRAGARGIVRT